jgi:hypothetical protein
MLSKIRGSHLGFVPVAVVVILAGSVAGASAASAGRITMRHHHGNQGIVTSVNGVATAGTCGTATATGNFTLVGMRRAVVTVDVVSTTTFTDPAVLSPATPSFADVCVGVPLKVLGTFATGTLTAASVAVLPPPMVGTQGIVTSVNGVATAGTCGTATATGNFTLVGMRRAIVTVDVTPATTFTDPAVVSPSLPSFADVCVGVPVKVLGTVASGVLTAASVAILPPPMVGTQGIVTSVNGVATTGTCGTATATGNFTLVGMRRAIVTVDVTPATTFTDPAVVSPSLPSFADVCVGSYVKTLGTVASGVLTAASVAILPPRHLSDGHRNLRGRGQD